MEDMLIGKCKFCNENICIDKGSIGKIGSFYDMTTESELYHTICEERRRNSVYVGGNSFISRNWIPLGEPTGLLDANGRELKTSDVVELNGCMSNTAIVGRSMEGLYMIFFGIDNISVGWDLNEKSIKQHKIHLIGE